MQVPETHYARAGDLRLAYQQWGDGPPLLIVPDLISNIEIMWEHELYRRVLEHLGQYMTCAYFDKRGIGLSDRFDDAPTLEQRNEDILAVMAALGWERAHVLGTSEGAYMGQLFAADFPERVESLTLFNTFVSPRYYGEIPRYMQKGDPWINNGQKIYEHFQQIVETWGEDASEMVAWEIPSQAGNESFTRWLARLQRMAASPRDFTRQLQSIMALDAGDAPERIKVRTLVMHVRGDEVLNVAMGRLLGDVIPGATYLEIDGADHFGWILPNWRDLDDAVIEFATGTSLNRSTTRKFGTVLFTDIVDSTRQSAAAGDARWRAVLDSHDRVARSLIDQHGGRVVKSTGDGLLALFDVPSAGVSCGTKLCQDLRGIGVDIRAGIHAGEVEVHDDGDISGIAVNLAARVEQQAACGELWASSTMRDLMLGGGASFHERGEHELKGIDGRWRLFAVSAA
jgi:class 3 adenylate cyclase/pimeloyl-ACP methyl ester carboxylesterase